MIHREFTTNSPTPTLAISPLTTSAHLVCLRMQDLAYCHLCELWDATHPPYPDSLNARKWSMATYVVDLARRHDVPGVLKRAFYELASSPAFREAVRMNMESVQLSMGDVVMLNGLFGL